MAHKVFICHSSTDKAIADAACAALEAQRIPCWIAPRDILAGEEYGESIIDAIGECQIMLLVFSAQANNSPQVRREIERGVSKGKIIVPFRIEDIMPSRAMEFALSNTHWLDALTPPMESYLLQLCDTISRLLQKHTVATEPPLWKPTDIVPEPPPPMAKPEPIAHHTAATPEPAVQPASKQQPTQHPTARKFPMWGWAVAAALCLVAVFALGRLFAPGSSNQPPPQPVPSPIAHSNTPVTTPQSANPAPAQNPAPPLQKQTTPPATATTRPTALPPAPSSKPSTPNSSTDTLVQQAAALADQQRFTEAAPLLEKACTSGSTIACDRLGRLNQMGKGVAQNSTQAVALYTKACDANFGEACRDLAMMYAAGTGVTQNYPQAVTLLTKACSEGVIGCNNLGLAYEKGLGVPQSYSQAATFYTKACDGGIPTGCVNLALFYENARGVAQNYSQAATLYAKACSAGEPNGCGHLGLYYLQGMGVTKDTDKARQLLTRSCTLGAQPACDKLKQIQ